MLNLDLKCEYVSMSFCLYNFNYVQMYSPVVFPTGDPTLLSSATEIKTNNIDEKQNEYRCMDTLYTHTPSDAL